MSGKVRVEIDLAVCTGHGRCYDLAPNVFADDERGYGQVIASEIEPGRLKEARSAAGACPERAILLTPMADEEA